MYITVCSMPLGEMTTTLVELHGKGGNYTILDLTQTKKVDILMK